MVDMLLIESYRLTVLVRLKEASFNTLRVTAPELRLITQLEPGLSDLMVNGHLVNNKCGNTMAKKTHQRTYFHHGKKIINKLANAQARPVQAALLL